MLQDPNTGYQTNTPLETFTITPGRRYRFRMINSFATVCPAQITIQGHPLVLIGTDGEPVHPVVVNTIISFSGKPCPYCLQSFQMSIRFRFYWVCCIRSIKLVKYNCCIIIFYNRSLESR